MATLKGVWVFNQTIPATSSINQSINFISNGVSFSLIDYQATGQYRSDIYYDDLLVYEAAMIEWFTEGEEYRTVDFGETAQSVSDDFYEWFTANAVQQATDEEMPIATITYKGSTLTTLNGGEYVWLHTKGEKLEDDIYIEIAEFVKQEKTPIYNESLEINDII